MSRFFLSAHAKRDLEELRTYLSALPPRSAKQIGLRVQRALDDIARYPHRGSAQSNLTLIAGTEVRSTFTTPYRLFYILDRSAPEIVAILHTAIMTRRFQ